MGGGKGGEGTSGGPSAVVVQRSVEVLVQVCRQVADTHLILLLLVQGLAGRSIDALQRNGRKGLET